MDAFARWSDLHLDFDRPRGMGLEYPFEEMIARPLHFTRLEGDAIDVHHHAMGSVWVRRPKVNAGVEDRSASA